MTPSPAWGAHLLGIFCEHLYSHEAFAREAQLRFPLLADVQLRGLASQRTDSRVTAAIAQRRPVPAQ